MKKNIALIVNELREHWQNYVFQSLLAALVMFLILLVLSFENILITASIGSTAFIVFTMPASITAKPRNVIGGHFLGALFGTLCALIPHSTLLMACTVYALAVGLSIFAMVVLNTEHPPAAGTALGLAMTGLSGEVALALVISVCALSLAHTVFRKRLRDLT